MCFRVDLFCEFYYGFEVNVDLLFLFKGEEFVRRSRTTTSQDLIRQRLRDQTRGWDGTYSGHKSTSRFGHDVEMIVFNVN